MTPQLWAWAGWCRLFAGDMPRAKVLAERALDAGEAADDDVSVCVALMTLCAIAHFGCDREQAKQLGWAAIHRADRSPGKQGHALPLNLPMALFHLDLDDFATAEQCIATGQRISAEIGYVGQRASYERASGVLDFLAGRWEDARTKALTATYFEDDVSAFGRGIVASAYLGYIELFRGDTRAAATAVATGRRRLAESGDQYRGHWIGWVHALTLEATGYPGEALAVLEAAWEEMDDAGSAYDHPTLGPDLVRLALAQGAPDLARRATGAAETASRGLGCAWAEAAALRCRGRLDRDPAAMAAAVEACRLSPRPVPLALACEDVADLDPSSPDVRALLEEALEIYERVGAAWAAGRVRSRMRQFGVRLGARGRRDRPKVGWESLTQTELKVVGLICEGMSNPQIAEALFLSRHTVRTHVSHVLAKVGLASRTELAVQAARRP
jgi:DNA-binding CsgD family transcriptional regulator